jgi:hypothetical protein
MGTSARDLAFDDLEVDTLEIEEELVVDVGALYGVSRAAPPDAAVAVTSGEQSGRQSGATVAISRRGATCVTLPRSGEARLVALATHPAAPSPFVTMYPVDEEPDMDTVQLRSLGEGKYEVDVAATFAGLLAVDWGR